MSTPDNFPFATDQQKAFISADLNSTLLLQFLLGIYSGLFLATMYIYIHKENRTPARDRIIIGCTTALYVLTTLNTVVNQWLYTNILFGTHGATRVEMFTESTSQDVPLGEDIINNLTVFAVYLLADGLLVWRCFHSCGRSFRKASLPIVLLAVEAVLVLTVTVYGCLLDAKPDFQTTQLIQISNRLNAATFVVVAATSLVSTAVICLQIWRHTTLTSRSRKRYQTIINVLVESSALYTVFVIFSAALTFEFTSTESSFKTLLILKFVSATTQIISGLAPTLMIARLVVSSGQEETEVSSACLPSDLIRPPVSHAIRGNMTNVLGTDLEMQQRGSLRVVEEQSEEILVVTRAEYQPKDELEDGRKTVV